MNTAAIVFGLGWGVFTAAIPLIFAPRPVSPLHLLISGFLATAGCGGIAVALGYRQFALVHIAYLIATLGTAVLAVGLAIGIWRGWFERSAGTLGFAGLVAAPGPLGLWATHVAPFRLEVDRAVVAVPVPEGWR